ncbi:MAG: hypothetical protein KatS3mg024_1509 [Armatimonadota bacterium]|nr:MAG: hypothetical protein KatS3mg024_1509 [Armatimonadota bacterium]
MNRLVLLLLTSVVMLSLTAAADAARVRFEFDPNDLMDLYGDSTAWIKSHKETQGNPRLRIDPNNNWSRTWYYKQGVQDPSGGGANQPAEGDAYVDWLKNLDQPGEGIASFNIWLLNKAAAPTWGEILVQNPNSSDILAGSSHSGWNWEIVDITPYNWGMNGYIVQWWTEDPNLYLRPTWKGGVDLAAFWFEADLYEDLNANGYDPSDPGAVLGKQYRIWFGSLDAFNYNSPPPAIQNRWEGVLTLTAAPPIPEPVFFQMGALLGLGGLGLLRSRKKS